MTATLDPSELDALMAAIQDGRVESRPQAPRSEPVVPFDLTSQDRIIRGQMPTLDSINERIASLFGTNLGALTRMNLRVASLPAVLMKFSDVYSLLGETVVVAIISLGPGHGLGLLLLDLSVARGLIAGALGDRTGRFDGDEGQSHDEGLTTVEKSVLGRVVEVICRGIGAGWEDVLSLTPSVQRFETDPRMTVIAPAGDLAVLSPYDMTGVFEGRVQLAMPYATIEPVKRQLSSPPRAGSTDSRFAASLARELHGVPVEMRVEIGRSTLTLARLLEVEPGDVLSLDTGESAPLPIYVEGRRKMSGAPQISGGSLAVRIDRGLAEMDTVGPRSSAAGPAQAS